MRIAKMVVVVCTLVCGLFGAVRAEAQTLADCRSPLVPKGDYKKFTATCQALAAAERASKSGVTAAMAGPTVWDSRTTVAGLNFSNVPTWSDADIAAQFTAIRDARYMTTVDQPGFQRRISWNYPDNGCFARAEQVAVRAAAAGKARPYKLFAFGKNPDLRVYTNNQTSGVQTWRYHVAPVVKNTAGEPIVLDASLSPCKPLPWKKWLAMMVDDMALYDNVAGDAGVALGDSWAYIPYSLASGEPPHSAESLTQQVDDFLPKEWDRQWQLGRDPNIVLGATPLWSGYACLFTEPETNGATINANSNANVTVTCPFGTKVVGGGFSSSSASLVVYKNAMSGNGWQISARNSSGSANNLSATAVCLTGAPSDAVISTVNGSSVSIAPNAFANSDATCGSGKLLIGGGYNTNVASGATPTMRVFHDGRTSSSSSTWRVSAFNVTSSSKSVNSYAYCLQTSQAFTTSQTQGHSLTPEGMSVALCPNTSLSLGGGFVFPRTTNYSVVNMSDLGGAYSVDMVPGPSSSDPNARANAQCLAHP